MRLWHKSMIEFLPDMQLKGQWRECALIAHELKKHGTPNHLLVNKVTEYSVDHFYSYCLLVWWEMKRRELGIKYNCLLSRMHRNGFDFDQAIIPRKNGSRHLIIAPTAERR